MEVISIIVSDTECPVLSIDTFGVMDVESKDEVVEDAENHFCDQALKFKFGDDLIGQDQDDFRDECLEALQDGYIHIYPHTVSIVWSTIDNIQL